MCATSTRKTSCRGNGDGDMTTTAKLSPREEQCLALAALGLTYRQIAAQLGLSKSTVHVHMKAVITKVGARNTTHAVAIVLAEEIARVQA